MFFFAYVLMQGYILPVVQYLFDGRMIVQTIGLSPTACVYQSFSTGITLLYVQIQFCFGDRQLRPVLCECGNHAGLSLQ